MTMTRMMRAVAAPALFAALLLSAGAAVSADGGSSSAYLKEIVQGRCYYRPPTKDGKSDDCPSIVDSLVGVTEAHLDSAIQASDFDGYVDRADFSSPKDKALFWLHLNGEDPNVVLSPPSDLVAPEDTPGGALMKDLVFCGVGTTCKKDESNAYWKFWQAAYSKFASQVRGKVQIVVEPSSDVQFLINSAISSLKKDQVTSVAVYGIDKTCEAEGPKKLLLSLKSAGFQGVSCDDDVSDLIHGESAPADKAGGKEEIPRPPGGDKTAGIAAPPPAKEGPSANPADDGKADSKESSSSTDAIPMTTGPAAEEPIIEPYKKRRHPFLAFLKWVFLLALISYLVYYLYKNGYIPSEWLKKVGYEPVSDADGGTYQRVSAENLPLHAVDDVSKGDSTSKGSDGIPKEKVIIQ